MIKDENSRPETRYFLFLRKTANNAFQPGPEHHHTLTHTNKLKPQISLMCLTVLCNTYESVTRMCYAAAIS